jgi:hypothetical protein
MAGIRKIKRRHRLLFQKLKMKITKLSMKTIVDSCMHIHRMANKRLYNRSQVKYRYNTVKKSVEM